MPTKSLIGVFVLICGLLGAGCDKEQAKPAQTNAAAPAPAPEATAWWKTEGQTTGQTGAAKLTGEPLPGWKKYAPVNQALAAKGEVIFTSECASCHTFGKGGAAGPDLQGLTHLDTPDWVAKFVADPTPMVKSDPHAKELMAKYLVEMPNMNLKPEELEALNAFFYKQDDTAVHGK